MAQTSELPSQRRITTPRKVLYSMVVLVAAFGLLELSARLVEIWLPPLTVDYGLGFDAESRVFRESPHNPGLRETAPDKLSNFTAQEFPIPKSPGTFRIAVLGGSSVYELEHELDELKERIVRQFADRFQSVEVINAGGRAYGSHREVPILLELLDYDLDLVIIYSGHNEFEEVEQLEFADLNLLGVNRRLARSAFVRLLRDRVAQVRIRKLQAEHNRRIMASDNRPFGANYVRAWRHQWTQEEVAKRMDHFRTNLEIMVQLCRARNVPVVLGTVPSNLARPAIAEDASPEVRQRYRVALDDYLRGNFAEAQAVMREILNHALGRHQSSDQENAIIRRVAQERQVPLADVEQAIIDQEPHGVPGLTLFYDHCHLNATGRKIWRKTFEPVIIATIHQTLKSTPQHP